MRYHKLLSLFGINLNRKDFYFFDLKSRYEDLSGYRSILKVNAIAKCYKSELSYRFINGEIDNFNFSRYNGGKDAIEYKHPNIGKLKVLLFREIIGGLKLVKEVHHFNGNSFLIKYSFPYIGETQRTLLFSNITQKYFGREIEYCESLSLLCNDNYEVLINDSVEFEVYHINHNIGFFNKLKTVFADNIRDVNSDLNLKTTVYKYL